MRKLNLLLRKAVENINLMVGGCAEIAQNLFDLIWLIWMVLYWSEFVEADLVGILIILCIV